MASSVLRELVGRHPPFWLEEPWYFAEQLLREWKYAWDDVCRRVLDEGTPEALHAVRDEYQSVLLAQLKILDGLTVLAGFERNYRGGRYSDRLSATRDELQKHYDSLFPRWQTQDDLEAILLERVSVPHAELKQFASKFTPPAAWYGEADDLLPPEG